MVLIWLATEQQAGDGVLAQANSLTEKLSTLEKMLDNQIG